MFGLQKFVSETLWMYNLATLDIRSLLYTYVETVVRL